MEVAGGQGMICPSCGDGDNGPEENKDLFVCVAGKSEVDK